MRPRDDSEGRTLRSLPVRMKPSRISFRRRCLRSCMVAARRPFQTLPSDLLFLCVGGLAAKSVYFRDVNANRVARGKCQLQCEIQPAVETIVDFHMDFLCDVFAVVAIDAAYDVGVHVISDRDSQLCFRCTIHDGLGRSGNDCASDRFGSCRKRCCSDLPAYRRTLRRLPSLTT